MSSYFILFNVPSLFNLFSIHYSKRDGIGRRSFLHLSKVYYKKVQWQIFIYITYMQVIVLALRYVRTCSTVLNSSPSPYPQLCHVILQCFPPPQINCSSWLQFVFIMWHTLFNGMPANMIQANILKSASVGLTSFISVISMRNKSTG